jgi:N-acetylglucosaminyl-diphospho-decaprenol L-rhamnosyltransferase
MPSNSSPRSAKSPAPLISAIIVNHDQSNATLEQLQTHMRLEPDLFARVEWIVVSNGTTHPSPIPGVTIFITPNAGYGAAINGAASSAQGETLLAMNADILPEPGFLKEAWDAANALVRSRSTHSPIGLVGFRLLDADGSRQGSAGRFPTLGRFLLGLGRSRRSRKYSPTHDEQPTEVDWVTGACVLIDRQCFESLAGFDESFFLYYEDVDLCWRAHRKGFRVQVNPRAKCRHLFPYHARRLTLRMVYVARRALLLYFQKHRPKWESSVVARIARLESWARAKQHPDWKRVGQMIDRLESPSEQAAINLTDWLAIDDTHDERGTHGQT